MSRRRALVAIGLVVLLAGGAAALRLWPRPAADALVMLQAVALVAGFGQQRRDDPRVGDATPVGARDAGSPIH